MDTKEATAIAKKYAELVAQEMKPNAIVLYGSTAYGTRRDDSDIDVAVIFDKFEGDWHKTTVQLYNLRQTISNYVEPLLRVRSKDKSGFVEEILRTGKVLFER